MASLRFLLPLFFLVISSNVFAEFYRWVDDKGVTRYSDEKKSNDNLSTKTVVINDKYTIPNIPVEEPIPYKNEKPNRSLSLLTIVFDMPHANDEDVRIGRIVCGPPADLYWTEGVVDLETGFIGDAVVSAIQHSGYRSTNAGNASPPGGSLHLIAKLKNVKLNICKKRKGKGQKTQNASYVKVDWALYDPVLDKELFTTTTKGSHDALSSPAIKLGTRNSFGEALANSARNLMAHEEFAKHITHQDLNELKEKFDKDIDVKFLYGDESDSFTSIVNYLKRNSAIVKSGDGHGSGVLINSDGHLLTNAHVVGDEEKFTIDLNGIEYKGELIRKERVRDVAIIKIIDYSGSAKGVKVSQNQPNISDEIFVIGTPLQLEFEHTITKGIISAKRRISGLPYFQTDAAINHGNSGGPVFDSKGELIALTVSGMFTQGGASLNINYLIPINDAIKTLGIKNDSTISRVKEQMQGRTVLGKIEVLLSAAHTWLNEPITKLF